MKGRGVSAKFGTQEDVGEGTVGCNLDEVVAEGTEGCDEVWVVLVKGVVLGDVYQKVAFNVFVLGGPDLLAAFVDDGVLVWVMVGGGTRRGGKEVWEKFGFWEDGERENAAGRSGRSWGWDDGDGGDNDRWQEVFYWDVCE